MAAGGRWSSSFCRTRSTAGSMGSRGWARDAAAGEGRGCGSTCRSAASLQVLVAGEAVGWGGGMASGSGRAATLSFVAKFF